MCVILFVTYGAIPDTYIMCLNFVTMTFVSSQKLSFPLYCASPKFSSFAITILLYIYLQMYNTWTLRWLQTYTFHNVHGCWWLLITVCFHNVTNKMYLSSQSRLLSGSRNPVFYSKGSLPCSQKLVTVPYLEQFHRFLSLQLISLKVQSILFRLHCMYMPCSLHRGS
jgi:hypothetical protein